MNIFCDLHIFLGFAYISPLLESMHALIKFAQSRDVFVCDLVATIRFCQDDIYNMYYYETFKFIVDSFWHSNDIFHFAL